jgi:hypothetical protein
MGRYSALLLVLLVLLAVVSPQFSTSASVVSGDATLELAGDRAFDIVTTIPVAEPHPDTYGVDVLTGGVWKFVVLDWRAESVAWIGRVVLADVAERDATLQVCAYNVVKLASAGWRLVDNGRCWEKIQPTSTPLPSPTATSTVTSVPTSTPVPPTATPLPPVEPLIALGGGVNSPKGWTSYSPSGPITVTTEFPVDVVGTVYNRGQATGAVIGIEGFGTWNARSEGTVEVPTFHLSFDGVPGWGMWVLRADFRSDEPIQLIVSSVSAPPYRPSPGWNITTWARAVEEIEWQNRRAVIENSRWRLFLPITLKQ